MPHNKVQGTDVPVLNYTQSHYDAWSSVEIAARIFNFATKR